MSKRKKTTMYKPKKLQEQAGVQYLENDNLQSVSFFIPLPSSVRIPDRHCILFQEIDDTSIVDCIRYTKDGLSRRIRHRVIFHALDSPQDIRPLMASMIAMERYHNLQPQNSEPEPPRGAAIVAQMSAITHRGEVSQQELTDLFDQALLKLREHLKSYYAVERAPITLPSRNNLPPMITVSYEDCRNDGERMPAPEPRTSIFMLNTNDDGFTSAAEPLPEAILLNALHSDHVLSIEILSPYLDTFREASLAHKRGETISASILYASSVEIMLDTLLLFLLWEEGQTPQTAHDIMYATKLCACQDCNEKMVTTLNRVNGGLYFDRIGGDWSKKSEFMKLWRELAEVRNRVVHTGFEPDQSMMENSAKSAMRLQTILLDYLVQAMDTYPLSGYFFAGEEGLSRRGMSSDINDYIEEEIYKPTSMQSLFTNWRFEVERLRSSRLQKTKDENCRLGYLMHISGRREWIMYDPELKLFRILNEQNPGKEIAATLQNLERDIARNKPTASILVAIQDVVPVTKTARIKWHPMYLTSAAMHAMNRWPISYLLPED